MELKNVNPNGCNVVVNNLHPMRIHNCLQTKIPHKVEAPITIKLSNST